MHQTVAAEVVCETCDLIPYFIQTLLPSFLSTHFPCRQNTSFFPKALLTHPSVIRRSHMGATRWEWGEGWETRIHKVQTWSEADGEDAKIPIHCLHGKTWDNPPRGLSAFTIPCTPTKHTSNQGPCPTLEHLEFTASGFVCSTIHRLKALSVL